MERLLFLIAFAVTSLSPLLAVHAPGKCDFPSAQHKCTAPGGAAWLEWREARAGAQHQLWLHDGRTSPRKLLDFERRVHVLWSTDGKAVAITDHAGSADTALWVFRVNRAPDRVNVEDALVRAFGRSAAFYKHGHRYFTARSWASPTRLVVDVRAYDARPRDEYHEVFTYDIRSRTVTRLRH